MSRVFGKPYYVYILWSPAARRFYIGISENPVHRLEQHNEGRAGWSARFRPWKLIHTEKWPTYRQARKRELQLKSQKSGQGFFALTGLNPDDFPRSDKTVGS
jgi:putative endonuclease